MANQQQQNQGNQQKRSGSEEDRRQSGSMRNDRDQDGRKKMGQNERE